MPEEYDSRLIEGLEEENIFRKLGTAITTSGERKSNIAGTKPAATWIEKGEALTFGDVKSDIGVTMNIYIYLGQVDAENEMIRMEELEQARKEVEKTESKKPMRQNMFKVV